MANKTAPTMKDVAKEAGVSLGTVSNVINGVKVKEQYKIKVDEAIKKLNYQINSYARGLKTSKTGTITLIIPTITHPFFAGLAYEIEQQAYKRSRKLILCCSNGIAEKELEYLSLAAQNKTDGIIALTYSDISNQVPEGIPLIAFDRYFANHNIPRLASDNYTGGFMAVDKLISLGCKRPAFVGFHSFFPGEADKRLNGYVSSCQKHHVEPLILNTSDDVDVYESIKNFIRENLDKNTNTLSFDGVFANTDFHACAVIKALGEFGINVPKDVQVIGFDGTKKFFPDNEYMVSTICQPLPELAKKALDMVLNEDEEELPSLTLLPVKYHAGGTTRE